MLKTLRLKNFTVFASAELSFCAGLNVIVGQNGTGKTHLLKAGYLMNRAWSDLMFKRTALNQKRAEAYFEERLMGLFQPVNLDHLIQRGSRGGSHVGADVEAFIPTLSVLTEAERTQTLAQFPFGSTTETLHWGVYIKSAKDLSLAETNVPLDASAVPDTAAVNAYVPKSLFIPSKEIVSMYEGLIALLDRYEIKLDATYGDLARSMNGPELTQVPALLPGVMAELENELGGKMTLDAGRLSFVGSDGSRTDGPLMAEGFRKLATLMYLIRRGALAEKGETLFWDEPETNLNPAYIRWVARALMWLANAGVQVILATHNLFLLREFEILAEQAGGNGAAQRYFALMPGKKGVTVSAGDSIESVNPLVLLDEDLAQSDRFMGTLK